MRSPSLRLIRAALVAGLPWLLLAQDEPRDDRIVLPLGPMADLLARLEQRGFEPVPPPRGWPAWFDAPDSSDATGDDRAAGPSWNDELPWREWVELLRAESSAPANDPERAERRARLALLAKTQGRGSDAWRHLLRCGEDPIVDAVLPALLPGVPLELLGQPGPLPPGVLLTPAVPPATEDEHGRLNVLAGRSMEHRDVRIGDTIAKLVVLIEGDGVQVDVIHTSGPPVDVRVLPPLPAGVEIGLLYSDWEKVATERATVALHLHPDEPRHSLWGRFRGRRDRWPSPRAGALRDSKAPGATGPNPDLPVPDLEVVVPPALAGDARLARFSEALSELFERPCTLRTTRAPRKTSLLEPISIHLGDGSDWERKLLGLISMIEATVLRSD